MISIVKRPLNEWLDFKRWLKWLWFSPTANTWLSLLTRSVSFVLVLPLILRKFPAEETAVWFVFSAVMIVQSILGFGFSPSFSRLLSYARAGADVGQMDDLRHNKSIGLGLSCNWDAIGRLCSCMRRVFSGLAVVNFVVLATAGTALVWRSVAMAGHPPAIWVAWGIMVISSSFGFATTYYGSILQGMNKLTESRRLETAMSLGAIFTAFLVLTVKPDILTLVIGYQFWAVAGFFAYRAMAFRLVPRASGWAVPRKWEPSVFRLVWNSAWKTGITSILTFGLVQSTGIIQAQFGSPTATVTYNFNLRLVTLIGQIVQAPFLTKLPELARLRAVGDMTNQLRVLRRGMFLTHWLLVFSAIGVSLLMPLAVHWIGSHSLQFDPCLWAIFSVVMIFERQGGMLHQIRNLTNQPMEHIAMIGYFVFNLTFMTLFLYLGWGMYSFPLSMLATQLIFSLWFAAWVAYPVLGVSPWVFERTVSLPPAFLLITFNAGFLLWHFHHH